MLANERYSIILGRIDSKGAVTVSELTSLLGISTETIRRDLLLLEQQHQLRRVHGGAVSLSKMKPFPSLSQRVNENVAQKRQLCQTAAGLIQEGDVIILDAGSTALELVPILKSNFQNLTVITHSLDVFEGLKEKESFRTLLIGGEYLKSENVFYGTLAADTIKNLHASHCFLFPSAVSLEYGVADYTQELVMMQKSYLNISDHVVILADSSKFEKTAFLKICDTSSGYTFITNEDLEESIYQLYLENHIKLYRTPQELKNREQQERI